METYLVFLIVAMLVVVAGFIYSEVKKKRPILGTITDVEYTSKGFQHQPVTIFTLKANDGQEHAFGVHEHDRRFHQDIVVEIWPTKEPIATSNHIREVTNSDGTTTVETVTLYWYKMRKFRILKEG